ncbi:Zinc finger MYND domain-containing protein 10, partial [Gonapodya sp. JEL0774]
WLEQHYNLERLNMQAHLNVVRQQHEFVGDAIITHKKLYHETVVLNLLELILFEKPAVLALDNALMGIVDYCIQGISWLTVPDEDIPEFNVKRAKEELELDNECQASLHNAALRLHKCDDFKTSILAISVFRYLTDHIAELPLSVITK